MMISPHIDSNSDQFPGDPTPQPPFGVRDSLRSLGLWSIGAPHLALWSIYVRSVARFTDTKHIDRAMKRLARAVTKLAGIQVEVQGHERLETDGTYVYVVNHVNAMDMFVIYQSIPGYTRSLELAEHFDWPLIGPLIRAAGQIPVDPSNKKITANGLRTAHDMLVQGDSLTVLPEGERTLDGTVGPFYPGAFRLAIAAGVPVVPVAMKGGRGINRRGDWRIRPGRVSLEFLDPISTDGLKGNGPAAAANLAETTRLEIIRALNPRFN